MPARRAAVLAGLLAAVVGLSGCGDDGARGPAGSPVPPPPAAGQGAVGAAATTTPAAELRAGLTWLLVERVHLLAQGRAALQQDGEGTTGLRAVRDRLGEVDDETARTLGGRPAPLLQALQAEVDVALAPRLDPAALARAHRRTVEVLAERTPGTAAERLQTALDRSTRGLAGTPARVDPRAAGAAAGLVANAVAAQRRLGSTETSAVVLRADLTVLLVTRAWTTGDPQQAEALDGVARALADRLGGTRGDELVVPLRAGHAALAAAAQAAREGDPALAERAREALAAADADLAARLARVVPALPAALLRRELDPARGPLLAAVGARARGDDDAAALSSGAARRAVVTAAAVAAGLADQQRLP